MLLGKCGPPPIQQITAFIGLLFPAQNALKLANGALEKYPDSDLLKVLKAIALCRQSRQADAQLVRLVAQICCISSS